MNDFTIERLTTPCAERDLFTLAALLVDAVDSGAAVSFLQPLSMADAQAWWRATLASPHPQGVVLVARERATGERPGDIVGTVQLQPAWAPNQPHRAELCKMIVHRRAQRLGLGRALMHAIEAEARRAGLTLLTLDAKGGGPAESLYHEMGWSCVGTIPNYALDPDHRAYHDTVIFYKELAASPAEPASVAAGTTDQDLPAMREVASHLRATIGVVLPRLRALTQEQVVPSPYPPTWSKIEVLGHLIDSACNNQMKFVLSMARPHTRIVGYAQNHWVEAQRYREACWADLVELWHAANRHLANVIERTPADSLVHTLTITGPRGDAGPFTLGFVMADYVEHLKHHLLQILPDAPITHRFQNVYGA